MSEFILDLYSDKVGKINFNPYRLDTDTEGECYYCKAPEYVNLFLTTPDGKIDTSVTPDRFCARCFMARAGLYLLRCYTLIMAIDEASVLWLKNALVEPATARFYGEILREHSAVKDIGEVKDFIRSCVGAVGGSNLKFKVDDKTVHFELTI